MAEELHSPRTNRRIPPSNQLQSPTSPFFLGSNDDKRERAQARARAAAIRRKPVEVNAQNASHGHEGQGLDKRQILELYQNCIKLASENKINQKNTWELNLIDHLTEIIRVDEEGDTETNFQKASCTLEAGVKIYSLRVDSVHSEAYKVLGGINRVGLDNGEDAPIDDANVNNGQEEGHSKKETKISPLSTLESFEALNLKKFDAAFAVDPLYHQTSAQFDEGGAKGLLLNNLGIFGGCHVLFDSMEVPGKGVSCTNQNINSDLIDLTFAKECVEQMVENMQKEHEITPTLKEIINQFDEENRRPPDNFSSTHILSEEPNEPDNEEVDYCGPAFDDGGTWGFDPDDQASVAAEEIDSAVPTFTSDHEDDVPYVSPDPNSDDRFENVDEYLFLSLGFTSKRNAWAGPEHWKFQKAKDDVPATEDASKQTSKKPGRKKQKEAETYFTLQEDRPDIFAPPKNPKSLLLPANRLPCNTTLPEDCHYQPEDLVKLFLRPNVMCLGRKGKKVSSESETGQQYDDFGYMPSWDDDGAAADHVDDGSVHSDMDDSSTLVSQPRQVNKIEVHYDKTSKQVDVQALKETLWSHMQKPVETSDQDQEETLSFRQVLANFPSESKAAAIEDITPHLCFICLLHLANEHGLSIRGCADLDDLSISVPRSG